MKCNKNYFYGHDPLVPLNCLLIMLFPLSQMKDLLKTTTMF